MFTDNFSTRLTTSLSSSRFISLDLSYLPTILISMSIVWWWKWCLVFLLQVCKAFAANSRLLYTTLNTNHRVADTHYTGLLSATIYLHPSPRCFEWRDTTLAILSATIYYTQYTTYYTILMQLNFNIGSMKNVCIEIAAFGASRVNWLILCANPS